MEADKWLGRHLLAGGKLICCAGFFFPVMKFCIIEREREERKAQLWLLFVSESGDEQKVCEATLCSAREVSLKVCWRVSDRDSEGELLFVFFFVCFFLHLLQLHCYSCENLPSQGWGGGRKAHWLFVQPSVSHQCSQSGSSAGHLSSSKSTSS